MAITECKYAFPLYADVSIVNFTCRVGEIVLRGIVKEKFRTKERFDEAVARGETAGLLEVSPDASDVFSTKLGNIPAGESIFVEISDIGELKSSDGDGVRFTIPTNIAPRYGAISNNWQRRFSSDAAPSSAQSDGFIKIVVDIDIPDGSLLTGVQSPSHPIAIAMGTLSTAMSAEPAMSKASATLALGSAVLEKDFVLIVQSKVAALPKALLETHPYISNQSALMATLVPRFTLPPTTSRPEIVFVADRSGSKRHNIPMLIDAMKVFLKSMAGGVKFNICSFGSSYSFLWPKSKTYDADTLKQASHHLQTFAANMGSTETFAAIKATIEQRWTDIALEVMLLTDGDIWRQNELFIYLNEQVEASKDNIRVFPLGIGSGVSHALIERVARAGNGFAQAVQQGERLDTSVVRMVRGALSPHITNYSLEVKYEKTDNDFEIIEMVAEGMSVLLNDVEAPEKKATISLFDTNAEPDKHDLNLGAARFPQIPTSKLLQAPHKIPTLFASSRTTVPLELEIPIEVLEEKSETIHQLAAKKASQDLEEGRGWMYDARDQNLSLIKDMFPSSFDDSVKKEAVRLGETFQVAGKWCSFVAVGADDEEIKTRRAKEALHETSTGGEMKARIGVINSIANMVGDSTLTSAYNASFFAEPLVENLAGLQDFDVESFLDQDSGMNPSGFDQHGGLNDVATNGTCPPILDSTHGEGNHALQGYEMQLMLLEQQSRRRSLRQQAPQFDLASQTYPSQMYSQPPLQRIALVQQSQSQPPISKGEAPRTHSVSESINSSIDYEEDLSPIDPVSVSTPYSPASPIEQGPTLTGSFTRQLVTASYMGSVQGYSADYAPDRQFSHNLAFDKLHALIELQNFDGSWPTDQLEKINAIVGNLIDQNQKGESETLWLTAIVAYMETKMSDEEQTWEMIVEKAKNWMGEQGDLNLDALEKEAGAFVAGI
ncbi:von Willebrand factor type A domain-containing protein [Amylocarpus encephaloides]|uniref:von Willebrand factor type A domain-containing protein n=1 Tax=Amylocarpus encephaloides TaxID=45428 RepID=A0A9P7YBI9_9HELO|nr:von Willebrand factor type A domain-containing protein [Amylocarpus encephaloides]